MKLQKTFINGKGKIIVRQSDKEKGGCGIVEILYFEDPDTGGYVSGAWYTRKADNDIIAEFQSVHDGIMTAYYEDAQILLDVLKWGQKLADTILDVDQSL